MEAKPRYNRIDNLRALSIISMVLYHAVWDRVFLYNFNWQWYKELPGFIWQQSICWCFILLSGFCHSMGRNPMKNALKVFICGLIVSAVTWTVAPSVRISFGVLTLLGSAGIICSILDKAFIKLKAPIGIILFVFLFAFTRSINSGSICFDLIEVPRYFYSNYITAYLGFPFKGFYSTDYFALLPWFNLYMAGYYLHKLLAKHNLLTHLQGRKVKPFSLLSKHSLLIYMLHQPVLSALFYLIF